MDILNEDVFIAELTIKKVRHLKDIVIPLSGTERKHLILTGRNGSGKTSVLEALKNFFHDPAKSKEEGCIAFKTNNGLEELTEYNWLKGFILAFYGAKRMAEFEKPTGLDRINFKDRYALDEKPGKKFIQHLLNLKAKRAFAKDDNNSIKAKSVELWFKMVEDSLRELFEDPGLNLQFDYDTFYFQIIQNGREPFDFNTLADGYSAILEIVADLIMRMETQKTNTYNVQGIVLIDEIEAHLHIDLQKKILPFLTRFFPRVQFIVSTHSPFILSSIQDAVIYDLEKKLLISDLSGYSYGGIVESYFNNDKYSQAVKDKLEQYEQLVKQKARTDDEERQLLKLKRYLEETPGELAPELKVRLLQIKSRQM